jgi:predicted nucleic acid-binding protein
VVHFPTGANNQGRQFSTAGTGQFTTGSVFVSAERVRLVDALYVALSDLLGSVQLVTTDPRLIPECELAGLIAVTR